MFLRIVRVYFIFKHSQWKSKPFGIKINIDLEAPSVENKIYSYWAHFLPFWTEHSGVTNGPLLPPKESKINRVMMSQGKKRLNLV